MTGWTTIRVKRDAKEAAEERKPDGMTWSEFIESEEYDPEVPDAIDCEKIARHVAEELESRSA